MAEMRYREALNAALREELARDERVILMGEDIGVFGGAFKVTDGLLAEFGELLVREGVIEESERARIDERAVALVDEAVEFAEASPFPAPESLYDDVYVLDQEVRGSYSVRTTAPDTAPVESLESSIGEIPQQMSTALEAGEDAS